MLEVKNITYKVKEGGKDKVILDNISFCCEKNQTIVITGQNGSGKSTLLKIIMGILPATNGKIFFDGQDITNLTIDQRANLGMAYSFQTPVCFKGITTQRLLEIASNSQDFNSHCENLSKLGLCARNYLGREVNNKLSGGEQKRIDLATVICRNAKLNLFDEPEAGIDIWSFDNLTNIFNIKNSTNLIVSHQQKLIEKADKILVMKNGKIEYFDSTDKILPRLNSNQTCQKLRRKNG